MNVPLVEAIADAVLYEGYILYPYRPTALKNRQRFNFGVVYSPDIAAAGVGVSGLHVECLARGRPGATVIVRARFLHLVERIAETDLVGTPWQEAVARDVSLTVGLAPGGQSGVVPETVSHAFGWPASAVAAPSERHGGLLRSRQASVSGRLSASAEEVRAGLWKVRAEITNGTPRKPGDLGTRGDWLMDAFVSAHAILHIEDGEWLSLLDPPRGDEALAASCAQGGLWPVLVGETSDRDAVLASPIILYDYPQIAPESPGEFCDGAEIDEMLVLRILTMTDAEKAEMRRGDERARQMLERTEGLTPSRMAQLHGALRGVRIVDEAL